MSHGKNGVVKSLSRKGVKRRLDAIIRGTFTDNRTFVPSTSLTLMKRWLNSLSMTPGEREMVYVTAKEITTEYSRRLDALWQEFDGLFRQ
jgi:hypothetical protein